MSAPSSEQTRRADHPLTDTFRGGLFFQVLKEWAALRLHHAVKNTRYYFPTPNL